MAARLVIGVDPGRTTGIAAFAVDGGEILGAHVAQCSHGLTVSIVAGMVRDIARPALRVHLGVERFVVGPRAARSRDSAAGAIARLQIGGLHALADEQGYRLTERSAAEVKPWATDTRLRAAGLLAPCTGMGHARDGARHALFTAVHDAGLPDPLIRHRSPR